MSETSSWPHVRIGDCCDILDHLRVPISADERALIPGPIPYYGANGVQGYIDKYLFEEPLILLAEDGGYFDEYQTRPIAYRVTGKCWVNNHAHILRVVAGSNRSQDFVFYALQHKDIVKFIKGGTRAKLNQSELRDVLIPDPPDKVQHRIAEILSTVDEAIEQTEALIEKTQQIKAGLMHDLFTRGVTENGELRPPREEAPQLYKESPIGWIPKEWEVAQLSDQIRIIDCKHFTPTYQPEGYPLVRPRNVKTGGLDFSSVDYVSEQDYKALTDVHTPGVGDIVFSRNASFGVGCYIDTPVRLAIGQDVVIMTETIADTKYIHYALASTAISSQILRISGGSTFGRINLADIRRLRTPVPQRAEQERIAARISAIDERLRFASTEMESLQDVKHGLMQDLLTGRVRVRTNSSTDVEEADV